jgi:hypothetical protein
VIEAYLGTDDTGRPQADSGEPDGAA